MNLIIALLPALGWGLMPLITGKVGGSPSNQIFWNWCRNNDYWLNCLFD